MCCHLLHYPVIKNSVFAQEQLKRPLVKIITGNNILSKKFHGFQEKVEVKLIKDENKEFKYILAGPNVFQFFFVGFKWSMSQNSAILVEKAKSYAFSNERKIDQTKATNSSSLRAREDCLPPQKIE